MNTIERKNGRFPKGKSGNATGRPPGSRNKSTLLAEQLLEGDSERITRKAIDKALEGDTNAIKLCLERILAIRRDRLISLPKKPGDPPTTHDEILDAIRNSILTPNEGSCMSNIVTARENSIVKELELRVKNLEIHLDEVRRLNRQVSGVSEDKPENLTLPEVKY